MNRYREISATFTLLFISFACSVVPALGAPGSSRTAATWDDVKRLTVGREVLVVQKDAKSFQGKLQSVSDATVVISMATGEQTIPKDSILRVSSKGDSHRWRNAGLGAGIGAGGGAGIAAAAGNSSGFGWSRGLSAAVGAVIGLAAGAAVGAALPTGGWHEVYRAH